MKHIEVYSTDNCPWRVRAKTLLESKGLDYEEVNISSDTDLTYEMMKRSGRRTVPQVFIDGWRSHRRICLVLGIQPGRQTGLI